MTDGKVRLQKYLAECGVASRRKSEELIEQGAVRVNGQVASIGDKINPKSDTVTVKGKKIIKQKNHTYIMLHKPRGFITTMSDERDRKCVAELIKDVPGRVYPVGRLDRDSEGMLLCTNDGEFANAMTHPRKHVPKTYRVTVRPTITQEQITELTTGIVIDDRMTAPAEIRVVKREEGRVVLEIILYEGRNRQIRKMCALCELSIITLTRVALGNITLGSLPVGKWRYLSGDEVAYLKRESTPKN